MHKRLIKNIWLTFVSTIAIAIFTATTATPRFYYSVTNLGTLDGYPVTYPRRINDLGQVAGQSSETTNGTSKASAFLWQNGNITNLGTLDGGSSTAFDINNSGQVVGVSGPWRGSRHAFLWQNGTMTDLGTRGFGTGDDTSVAQGINSSGQIVGWSCRCAPYESAPAESSSLFSLEAVLWKKSGITDLGTISGDNFSQALAINNQGQIFGVSGIRGSSVNQHIFRWQNGVMTNLGKLVPSSQVNGINNRGQVIGSTESLLSGSNSPFLWQNGIMTDLGNLGGTQGSALGINAAGTVVGSSSLSSGTNHAFIWRNGRMRDLNNFLPPNSDWELEEAVSINNKGQIVGTGTFNGQRSKGFLLTPVSVSN